MTIPRVDIGALSGDDPAAGSRVDDAIRSAACNQGMLTIAGLPELWTAGKVRATVHRVIGSGRERYSIPFFYEAAVNAVIAPLPRPDAAPFEPFYFGDFLWNTTTKFVEQRGIAHH